MPRSTNSISVFQTQIDTIIEPFGTLEHLRYESSSDRSRNGSTDLKKLLKKVLRLQRKVDLMKERLLTSTTSPSAVIINGDGPQMCNNCRRVDAHHSNSILRREYGLIFHQRTSDSIPVRRQFKFIKASRVNRVTYSLCQECNDHLQEKEDNPDYNSFRSTWPAFIWYLLTDPKILFHYEPSFLWKLIPQQWRSWWLPSLKNYFARHYESFTTTFPQSLFLDKTEDLSEWDHMMETKSLPNIAKCCNKHLMPTVLCPWGCTTYIHKHGSIPFCTLLQKYMLKTQFGVTKKDEMKFIFTARDDYIRESVSNYDNLLLNHDWKVMPTVIIDPVKGPVCLTCPDHKKGSVKYMIHTCRQPIHNIPALRPDQLAPCVLRPRTVKPVKKSKFSTTYQMHEQKGSFNGIDTCSLTFFGKFDFQSTLSAMNDARIISQRPDINAHLDHLVKERIIPSHVAAGRRQDAAIISRTLNYERYYSASTYIPLKIALSMQKQNAFSRFAKSFSYSSNQYNNFQIAWPEYTYPCQTLHSYGTQPHLSPSFRIYDKAQQNSFQMSRLWSISTLLLSVQPIWQILASVNEYDSVSWQGWLLIFLSKQSLHHLSIHQDKMDPFKFSQISSTAKVTKKLVDSLMVTEEINASRSFFDLFVDYGAIHALDMNSFQPNDTLMNVIRVGIDPSVHRIVIIENVFNDVEEIPEYFRHETTTIYELRHISYVDIAIDNSWRGMSFMRHGGPNHTKWWNSCNTSQMYVQMDGRLQIEDGYGYILVYVRCDKTDLTEASKQVMSHIGGQSLVQCLHHKLPMIVSTFRKGKCFCSKQEYYRCPDFNCNIKCCKVCLDSVRDTTDITYVHSNGMTIDPNHMIERHYDAPSEDEDSDSDMESIHNETVNHHTVDQDTEVLFDQSNVDDDNDSNSLSDSDHSDSYINDDTMYDPMSRNEYEDYVTTAEAPDFHIITDTHEEQAIEESGEMPLTDSGIYPFEITENEQTSGALQDLIVTGNVLLNQCGTLLTRNSHQIKGSSRGKLLMQRICAATIGHSVPLLQPEAVLIPSIYWKMVPNDGVIAGAIPTPLLSEKTVQYGFQTLPQHFRTRLSQAGSTSSTDPNSITLSYDQLTNQSATHLDTRVAMSRGLTADKDTLGGLGVRGGSDSSGAALLGSIDSNQMVKNLCASQRLHPSSFFCTFTCAQSKHFGTKNIKNWIDGEDWKKEFPNYTDLSSLDQNEINKGMQQSAACPLLRNWQEVCKIFIDYLRTSPTSPFRKSGSIFARNEYQKDAGNLSHIHMMIEVKWDELSNDEKSFVDNLIRTNHLDICTNDEVDQYVAEGIFDSQEDQHSLHDYGKRILRHTCSERCLERTGPGPNDFRCRHSNNVRDNPDPKNNHFLPLPNSLPDNVKQKLVELGLIDEIEINELNYETPFHCKDDFFHPTRYIPATNPTEDVNISPVDAYTFAICQSMQNFQLIKGTGGCNKYVCKYVGKIDEQNFVVVKANPRDNGQLVTQSNFLHNTKITGSKINEDAAREKRRDNNRPMGRKISLMEMIHVMLKYPEVFTDLRFINVPTYPLAFRKSMGVSAKHNSSQSETGQENDNGYGDTDDAASREPHILSTRNNAMIASWREHTEVETTLIKDLYRTRFPIDAITRFSIRPPELRKIFNSPGDYYRWFTFSKTTCKDSFAETYIQDDLYRSAFIDGIQHVVKIRLNAIDEILTYLEDLENAQHTHDEDIEEMLPVLMKICNYAKHNFEDNSVPDMDLVHHIQDHFVDSESCGLLPICVYSQIRPTGGINFVLHILLSMGRFDTEMEMTVHETLRECLRNAKLIGPSDDPTELKKYSDALLLRYIQEQLKYFSNSRKLIIHWIEVASSVFDSVIIHNEIPVTEMPSAQLTAILASREEADVKFMQEIRFKLAKAVLKEIGEFSTNGIIPTFDDIMGATRTDPFHWNPVECHARNEMQSIESYDEQQCAIKVTIRAIDRYSSLSSSDLSTKNIGIRGFPGGGKTWCSMYCILYALSKGLNCLATAVMAKRATQLGGTHWHKFFCLPVEKKLTPHRLAEIAINKLMSNKTRYNAVLTLDVILADEFGQLSAEFISAIDIILRNVRTSNTIFGGILIIGTLDHTQIQPWEGRPFLTSPQLIPTFEMVNLKHSVRTNNIRSQRIQTIARLNYRVLKNDRNLVNEFMTLASDTFTFVDSWDNEHIVPSTFRVYSKRVPAVDAAKEFIDNVTRTVTDPSSLIIRNSIDTQKARFTTSDWRTATLDTSHKLEEKIKPPGKLLFFRGAVYECTYNHKDGEFNQSQIALLYDMPTQEDVQDWKSVKVLIAPPALKDVEFDMTLPKDHFLNIGFKEIDIEPCPERPISISRLLQAQRKQYGLKHRVTGTIHSAMGDTYESMATKISTTDKNFSLWDKGQLIVIISRTRDPKKTIFVGNKRDTLEALQSLLLKRTQWTDFMEHILDVITINSESERPPVTATTEEYPFQISNIDLPQCQTGFVYMLVSLRRRDYTYIGTSNCIRTRIVQHNSGYGSRSTEDFRLRPFAMMAYICGFGGDRDLMYSIEQKWKIRRDQLRLDGNDDPRDWAKCGEDVIRAESGNIFGDDVSPLKLVLLFKM